MVAVLTAAESFGPWGGGLVDLGRDDPKVNENFEFPFFCLLFFCPSLVTVLCFLFPLFLHLSCFDCTCGPFPSLSLAFSLQSIYIYSSFFKNLYIYVFPVPSFGFYCLFLFLLVSFFPSLWREGYQKGFRNATLACLQNSFFLAPRPNRQIKLQGRDDREAQPSHPPRKSNKKLTPQNPQTKLATNLCTKNHTSGQQQGLKGELHPNSQQNKVRLTSTV